MTFENLIVLVPCHSLEDFPVDLEGRDADSLLAAWTALWHPDLVAVAGSMPRWCPASEPPEMAARTLFTIPTASRPMLPENWTQSLSGQGAVALETPDSRSELSRSELIEAALGSLDGASTDVDPDLVADFLALGYGYLQTELLTRDMRYTNHVDEVYFGNLVTKAAAAAVAGETKTANEALDACFDVLSESRDHFYPVDSYLVDLTLVAPPAQNDALGDALRRELRAARRHATATNLLVSGKTAEQMAEQQPETLAEVKRAMDENLASLVGGEYESGPLAFMTHEAILSELRRGQEAYEHWLGRRAKVYGRQRFGLSPLLPGVLRQTGFIGALHFTLDGGRTPRTEQSKASWEGVDGAKIDVLTRLPQNVSDPSTFLNLARRLSNSMERDHVATMVLAHYPGEESPWLEDLRRVAARGLVLGKFVTLEQYFETTDVRGDALRFAADQYRWPYLSRSVAEGNDAPISRPMTRVVNRAADEARASVRAIAALVDSAVGSDAPPDAKPPRVPLASGNVLRNEHMEVTLNMVTGAIHAIHDDQHRGNLLSVQLAYRDSSEQPTARYSVMASDEMEVTASDSVRGEITVRGRLVDRQGRTLARFVERLQLARHRPVLEIDLQLDTEEAVGVDPWQSYYAMRFAWADETAELWRSELLTSQPSDAPRFVAPHFVDIRGRYRLAILPCGLPFHVRSGPAMLDTLLIAGKERQRRFRLGVALGQTHPVRTALDFMAPSEPSTEAGPPQTGRSGLFFHINRKNVIATAWEPLRRGEGTAGFRVRLLETEGRAAEVRLASFRAIRSARRTDLAGQTLDDLHVEDGCVCLRVGAYAWTQVEAEW